MPTSNTSVTETIDERILRLIGLDEVFDLDYSTYLTLLKEAMVKGRMTEKTIPTEEIMLLDEEYRRVKKKKDEGRFKVKKKKITADSITNLKILKEKNSQSSPKFLPGSSFQDKNLKKEDNIEKSDSLQKLVSSIKDGISSIAQSLKSLIKIIERGAAFDRKKTENEKRKRKEDSMESSSGKIIKSVVSAAIKPFESIFDKIFKFIFWTLLGNTFFKLLDWFNDSENQNKIKTIFRFLKDWWPAILTGFLAFATPLGGFIATIVGTLIRGLFMLAKVNPKLTAAIALFTAGATIPMLFPKTVDEQERKIEESPGTDEEKLEKLKEQKQNLNWFQKNIQGMGPEIDEQIHRLETGETKSYSGGGEVSNVNVNVKGSNGGNVKKSSGIKIAGTTQPGKVSNANVKGNSFFDGGNVKKSSGIKITGAGPDTQLIAAQPGEVVINKKAVDTIGADKLLALNSEYGGPNANKPKFANNIRLSRFGGIINAFENGGIVSESSGKSQIFDDSSAHDDHDTPNKDKDKPYPKDPILEAREKYSEQLPINTQSDINISQITKKYQGGGIIGGLSKFLPGTGTVMAPRSSGPRDIHGRQQTTAGYQNKILGVPVGGAYYPRGGDGQYSKQENRRYYERTGKHFVPTDFGPRYKPGIHGLYTPPQRTPPAGSGSTTNPNLNRAIKNARDVTNLPGGSGYRPLVEKAADTSIRMQQRYDTLRDVMKKSGMSGANESMNLRGQPIKRQGGGMIGSSIFNDVSDQAKEKTLPRAISDFFGFGRKPNKIVPQEILYDNDNNDNYSINKKQGRGSILHVEENEGGHIPGATSDRERFPIIDNKTGTKLADGALQPGEYVFPKLAVNRVGGPEVLDRIVAALDPNSDPSKKTNIVPLSPNVSSGVINLPPSVIDMRQPTTNSSVSGSRVSKFSVNPISGSAHREMIKRKYYGIG
jgi:hypothetical protein